MGILDIMELLNNPEFFERIESRVDLFLTRCERIEAAVELIAEKLELTQDEIRDRIILKRGLKQKEAANAEVS